VLRLFCALLAERNDEWLVGQHRYFSEASMAKILNPKEDDTAAATTATGGSGLK
jgi:hypothetical protein